MNYTPLERSLDDATSAGIIISVDVDVVKIAPKKTYSMGGHDYTGLDYHGLLVRVRTEDGVEGIGEVFLTPGWYGADTPLGMIYLIKAVFAPALVGESVFNVAKIGQLMDRLWTLDNRWSKAALEQAVFDAAAKTLNRPLVDLLGGRVRDSFPVLGGIGTDSPDNMAASAREYVDRGFKTLKLKIGEIGNPGLDVDRVRLVREEVGPNIIIRTDANSVFDTDVRGAISLARKLEPYDLDHIEQPLAGWNIEGMARLREAIDIPLMADESVHSLQDMVQVIKAGAADVVKLKVAKNGGFQKCREIVALCVSAGIRVEMGNGIQSSVASLHELAFACACPDIQPAGEFPGPDKLVSDILLKPMVIVDGEAILSSDPGIGSELDYDAFASSRIDIAAML
jgi:L-alanine-DL-glutamate epimerase-like enolase superfamily enzyme|tara:strand:- start:7861 stop:9048 length:1188 start_codon:yes stop_codon:yes gene_type:complete